MIELTRPDGGRTWVHESRLEEYLGLGYKKPSPAPANAEPEAKPAAPKKTTRRKTAK